MGDYELVVPAPGSQPVAHTDSEHDSVVARLDTSAQVLMLRFDREHWDIDRVVYRTYGPGVWGEPMTQASNVFFISHNRLVAADKGTPVEPFVGLMSASGILLNARKNKWIAGSTILSTYRPVIPSHNGNHEALADPRVRTPGGWTAWDKSLSDSWVGKVRIEKAEKRRGKL